MKLYIVKHTNGFVTRVWARSPEQAITEAQKHVPLVGGTWTVLGWEVERSY